MRWDLLDRFEILKKGSHSRAFKTFSGKEDFFLEHFPGSPRVPQTLMVEMIAQAGGVLLGLGFDFSREVVLAKISDAKFFKEVAPPCTFQVDARVEYEKEEGGLISGTIKRENEVIAEAEILLAAVDSLSQNKKIVFNDNFLKHFDIYRIAQLSETLS